MKEYEEAAQKFAEIYAKGIGVEPHEELSVVFQAAFMVGIIYSKHGPDTALRICQDISEKIISDES